MGRNRKSSDELERSGAFRKNPARARARASEPAVKDPLGPPPRAFQEDPELLEAWHDVLAAAKEVKLTSADRLHVEMTAKLVWKCRQAGARAADYGEQLKYFGKFGLTRSDRSKVEGAESGKPKAEHDDWLDLAEEGAPRTIQ